MDNVGCTTRLSILLLLIHSLSLHASHIQIDSDGGYKKLVVAIPTRVNQSPKLLKDLQDFLSNVSKKLHAVTRDLVYFKNIQILVPHTWDNYPEATFETYSNADIRFDSFNPSSKKGNLYTQQPRGCGEKGDFIYLNPEFVTDWKETDVIKFVQEWSKYRYGVFDEYGIGNDIYPKDYPNGIKELRRSGCTLTNKLFKSIMDNSDDSVGTAYCDNTKNRLHNKYAPTPQNTFCNLKSTWEVIENNLDLRNKTEKNRPQKPTFTIVKASSMHVVFVFDPLLCERLGPKGSHMLELTLQKFLMDFPPNGKIGFIIADGRHDELKLEKREMKQHLRQLKEMATSINHKKRNIKDGIEKGIKLLSQQSQTNGHLILISDGPKLKSKDLKSVFIKLDILTFFLLTWTRIDLDLKYNVDDMKEFIHKPNRYLWMDIRVKTSILNCDPEAIIQIEDAIALFFARFGNEDFYPKKIKIYESTSSNLPNKFVNPLQTAKLIFNSYFCNVSVDDKRMSLNINGNDVSNSVSRYDMVNTLSLTYIMENSPTIINYEWYVYYPQKYEPSSSVWLQIDDIITPEVILTGQIQKESKSNSNILIPWKFYAFSPNANIVSLEVTKKNGDVFIDHLRDNGNGDPDLMANDQIYSRYFINTTTSNNERISFRIIAKSKNNATLITNIGSFYVPPLDSSKLPPNRIADFHVDESYKYPGVVILKWTAPGGNLDHYKTEYYYMNCVTNFTSLTTAAFNTMTYVQLDRTIPKLSGEQESFICTCMSTDYNKTHYCTIVSVDSDKNASEKSNIVAIRLRTKNKADKMQSNGIILIVLCLFYCIFC